MGGNWRTPANTPTSPHTHSLDVWTEKGEQGNKAGLDVWLADWGEGAVFGLAELTGRGEIWLVERRGRDETHG